MTEDALAITPASAEPHQARQGGPGAYLAESALDGVLAEAIDHGAPINGLTMVAKSPSLISSSVE